MSSFRAGHAGSIERIKTNCHSEAKATIHEIRLLSAQAILGHKSAKMAALYLDEQDGWFRPRTAKLFSANFPHT
jgi:hypothetical protein